MRSLFFFVLHSPRTRHIERYVIQCGVFFLVGNVTIVNSSWKQSETRKIKRCFCQMQVKEKSSTHNTEVVNKKYVYISKRSTLLIEYRGTWQPCNPLNQQGPWTQYSVYLTEFWSCNYSAFMGYGSDLFVIGNVQFWLGVLIGYCIEHWSFSLLIKWPVNIWSADICSVHVFRSWIIVYCMN